MKMNAVFVLLALTPLGACTPGSPPEASATSPRASASITRSLPVPIRQEFSGTCPENLHSERIAESTIEALRNLRDTQWLLIRAGHLADVRLDAFPRGMLESRAELTRTIEAIARDALDAMWVLRYHGLLPIGPEIPRSLRYLRRAIEDAAREYDVSTPADADHIGRNPATRAAQPESVRLWAPLLDEAPIDIAQARIPIQHMLERACGLAVPTRGTLGFESYQPPPQALIKST